MSGELHTDVEPEEVPPSSPWLGRERLAGLSLVGLGLLAFWASADLPFASEFGVSSGLVPRLLSLIVRLPREDRWQSMARAALRDDLHAVHARLTANALAGDPPPERDVQQAVASLAEICSDDEADLARVSVALRVVRSLL